MILIITQKAFPVNVTIQEKNFNQFPWDFSLRCVFSDSALAEEFTTQCICDQGTFK